MKPQVSHISYKESQFSLWGRISIWQSFKSQISNLRSQISIIVFCLFTSSTYAQVTKDTIRLSLPEVVELARQNSIAAKQAVSVKETKYWEWRTFKSNYQPQLSL